MRMISNQIRMLMALAQSHSGTIVGETLFHAADTIKELSVKLANANMDRSTAYYKDCWIPVFDRLPEIEEYYKSYWVTILTKDSRKNDFYYVRKATWNQYDKRWEEDCGKPVSDKINIIAWREYDMPAPYKQKIGE